MAGGQSETVVLPGEVGQKDLAGDITEVLLGLLSPSQDFVVRDLARHFHDEGPVKTSGMQLVEERSPVDGTFTGRTVIVSLPPVVVGMNHPEMAGQLMDDGRKIAGEIGVTRVEADPDMGRLERSENPEEITYVAGKEMGQHVLQHQSESELNAALGHAIETSSRCFQAAELL